MDETLREFFEFRFNKNEEDNKRIEGKIDTLSQEFDTLKVFVKEAVASLSTKFKIVGTIATVVLGGIVGALIKLFTGA